jgi:hypothetical protein
LKVDPTSDKLNAFYRRPPHDLVAEPDPASFAEHFPIPTMARAGLECCLNPQQLDAWFETVAGAQYTRTLLFSTLFQLMLQVVSRQQALDPCGLSGGAGADRGVGEIGLQQTQRVGTWHLGGVGALQRRTGDGLSSYYLVHEMARRSERGWRHGKGVSSVAFSATRSAVDAVETSPPSAPTQDATTAVPTSATCVAAKPPQAARQNIGT